MAVSPDTHTRATHALASEPVPRWTQLSTVIMNRIRAIARPGEHIATFAPDGSRAYDDQLSQVYVAQRALIAALRRAIVTPAVDAEGIELFMDHDRCRQIHLRLVGSWGADLQGAGATARRQATIALGELLGPDPHFNAPRDLQISITDVDRRRAH